MNFNRICGNQTWGERTQWALNHLLWITYVQQWPGKRETFSNPIIAQRWDLIDFRYFGSWKMFLFILLLNAFDWLGSDDWSNQPLLYFQIFIMSDNLILLISYTQQVLKNNTLSNILNTFPLQFSYHGWSTNPWLVPLTSSLVASGMSGSLISRPMNSSIFAWPIVYQCTYTSICLVITKQYIQYNQQYNQNSNPANSVSTAFMYIYEPIEPSLPGNVSPCTVELRNQMQNVEMFWKETSFFIIAITMILASFDLGISPYWKRSCSGSKRNSWIEIKNKGRSLAQIMRKNIE